MFYHGSDSGRRLRPPTPTKQKGQHKPCDKSADESSEDPDDDCAYKADADPSNDSVSEKTCDATDNDP
jgi:cell division septation protein DedD